MIPLKHLQVAPSSLLVWDENTFFFAGLSWDIMGNLAALARQGGSRAFDSRASRPFKIATGTRQGGKQYATYPNMPCNRLSSCQGLESGIGSCNTLEEASGLAGLKSQ